MKKTNLIIAAVLASAAFFSSNAFAETSSTSTGSCVAKATLPVPVKVVPFSNLPRTYANATVVLTLVIDEAGVPHDVKAAAGVPKDLAARLVPLVSQWRFAPSRTDGRAVSTRVILPLELVEA